ncbi:peptidase S8/S53 domain-containing protein [Mycena alexandri]|uniref:Peptidase S8/S53 domain-containing protein n=1 Tax=Mycena alexandri TaxID=1745969 RepID=A0AAD6XG61_9AGAR|nr:peptidase S8/S53 domain-containing protein [Mycena alexandri]
MLTLVSLTLAAVAVAQTLSPSVQHAKRSHLPAGWSRVRRHAQDAVLPLRFGLTQSNVEMNTLEQLLNDVSHPESLNYGKHWTPGRVAEHFAPSEEAVHAVTSWIVGSGFPQERVRVSETKGWVMINASVAETEKLLNTQYHVYKHKSGKEHIACEAYYLPAHIVPHVALVTPSIDFNAMLAKRASDPTHKLGQPVGSKISSTIHSDDLDNCDVTITPACVRALYDFRYSPVAADKNSFGIVEYTPQAYRAADLDLFAKNFTSLGGESLVGARPVFISVQGGVVQTTNVSFEFNVESNFDLAYAMNLVTGHQPVTLYQVGDFEIGASFNNFLDALDGSYCTFKGGDDPTTDSIYPDPLPGGYKGASCCLNIIQYLIINSCSTRLWHRSYADNEADLSPAYAIRQCAEYAKLGLMGVTVLYSSGDNGVAGNDALCLNPDDSQTEDGLRFNPLFPGTCPFVVGVGGTQINPGSTVTDPESAAELSSGGFSNYFSIPDYQKSAVAGYLKANPPPFPSSVYNATSRVFPDISSNAVNFTTTAEGIFFPVSGTSASSPVVGAILSMINDARLAVGKGPIGFINPAIYSAAFKDAFNDITDGSNPGCGTPGFAAARGYDPVTGLGTPNFPKLLKLWLALP